MRESLGLNTVRYRVSGKDKNPTQNLMPGKRQGIKLPECSRATHPKHSSAIRPFEESYHGRGACPKDDRTGEITTSVDSILSQTGYNCEITLFVLVNLAINVNRAITI